MSKLRVLPDKKIRGEEIETIDSNGPLIRDNVSSLKALQKKYTY